MATPDVLYQTGIHASRPAVGSGCVLYTCTTHGLVYRDDGSSWTTFITLGGSWADVETDHDAHDHTGIPGVGAGGGGTISYLGKNAVGGTAVAPTQDDAHTKAITIPSGGALLCSIELYIKSTVAAQPLSWAALLYDDDGSGTKPKLLLQASDSEPSWPWYLYRVAATAGDARWAKKAMAVPLPAGVFHIGFEVKGAAGNHNVYYDAGSDWKWSKGGNTFFTDAPGTSGTVYTLTNSTRDYSLRAGILA